MARPRGRKDSYKRTRRTNAAIELAAYLPPVPDAEKGEFELPLYGLLRRIASDDPDIEEKYRHFLRIAVLPYLHPRASSKLVAKPYFMMSDAELVEVRRLELEHERQIERSRKPSPVDQMISPQQRALWRRDWLKGIDVELARRRSSADDGEKAAKEAAEEWFFEELRQMAERMAAAAHLGPPPDKDDRSIAERLAAVLYLPMDEAEREREEATIKEWFDANGNR